MDYPIFVGLDVHLSSISAAAFCSETGKNIQRSFKGDDIEGIVKWAHSLGRQVKAVYESGFCGFHLQRALESSGIPCAIAAISKLPKPSGDKIKTDRRDALFLARQFAVGNVICIHVPSLEREGMRDIARAFGVAREDLTAAKLRVMQTHNRYGLRYPGTERAWTLKWTSWAASVCLPSTGAQRAYEHHYARALILQGEKKALEKEILKWCEEARIREKIIALCAIKGISKVSAFCLVVEIGSFARFKSASGFSAFLGLVPSESSSGKTRRLGNITRTGNEYARKALIEAAWCYSRMKTYYKVPPSGLDPQVSAQAQKANRRLFEKRCHLAQTKKPCVANAAVAREMAGWVWTVASMVEKGL